MTNDANGPSADMRAAHARGERLAIYPGDCYQGSEGAQSRGAEYVHYEGGPGGRLRSTLHRDIRTSRGSNRYPDGLPSYGAGGAAAASRGGPVRVRAHTRSDGTYLREHTRARPSR